MKEKLSEKITPCLWFDGQAKDAAALYCSAFPNARITSQSPIVTGIDVSGQSITLLDGGPKYKPNPSITFYVVTETVEETDRTWNALAKGGEILMPLDKYPWGDKYGWVIDKFGVAWEIGLGKLSDVGQKITPHLVFTGKQYGRAEEAMKFYSTLFKTDKVDGILHFEKDQAPDEEGKLMHAQFALGKQKFMVADSAAFDFMFTEGVSLTIHCETQDEIDYYWNHLTEKGGQESMCGWLKDRFGVSWQIIPVILSKIMSDPQKAGKAAQAFMSMRKLNIEQIVQATL